VGIVHRLRAGDFMLKYCSGHSASVKGWRFHAQILALAIQFSLLQNAQIGSAPPSFTFNGYCGFFPG